MSALAMDVFERFADSCEHIVNGRSFTLYRRCSLATYNARQMKKMPDISIASSDYVLDQHNDFYDDPCLVSGKENK